MSIDEVKLLKAKVSQLEADLKQIKELAREGREARKALKVSQEQLTRAISVSKIGFFDWDIPHDIVTYSDQLKEDWGITTTGAFQDAIKAVHPDDRDLVRRLSQESIKNKTPFHAQYRVFRPSGEMMWIEAQGKASYNSEDKPVRFFGTSIEITEQKQAADALKRTSDLLKSLMSSTTDLIFVKDRKARMVYANPETLKMLNSTAGDIYGKNDIEFLGPGSGGEGIVATDKKIMESGVGQTVQEWVTWKSGKRCLYMSRKEPQRDADGKVIGLFGISRDITDLKKTQSDLEDALKARDVFLGIASHELKTPLTSLKLQGQIAKRNLEKNGIRGFTFEGIQKLIDNSNFQTNRLAVLVDDMLDTSRIASGKLSMNFEKTDLSILVEETLGRVSPQLRAAHCDVSVTIEPHVEAEVDPFRFEQILTNLVINATKYAPGAPIGVSLIKDSNKAILKFKDHGPGIPPDKFNTIFGRFERLDGQLGVSGLGLGLYISSEIVSAHHGKIYVESELGKGAEFTVSVPLVHSARTLYEPKFKK